MNISEQDLEDWIYNSYNENEEIVRDAGLPIYGKLLRQVELGNYGRLDLVSYTRYRQSIGIRVYELKKGEVGTKAFLQAVRYAKAITRLIKIKFKQDVYLEIDIYLVGSSFEEGDFVYISDVIPNVHVYTFDFGFQGIKFKEVTGWKLTNEGL